MQIKFEQSDVVVPSMPTQLYVFDGVETFAIDKNTIGVKQKWIDVNKSLPQIIYRGQKNNPSSDPVLATDGVNIEIAIRWQCDNGEYFLPNYRENCNAITHWMPLPELPKE